MLNWTNKSTIMLVWIQPASHLLQKWVFADAKASSAVPLVDPLDQLTSFWVSHLLHPLCLVGSGDFPVPEDPWILRNLLPWTLDIVYKRKSQGDYGFFWEFVNFRVWWISHGHRHSLPWSHQIMVCLVHLQTRELYGCLVGFKGNQSTSWVVFAVLDFLFRLLVRYFYIHCYLGGYSTDSNIYPLHTVIRLDFRGIWSLSFLQ